MDHRQDTGFDNVDLLNSTRRKRGAEALRSDGFALRFNPIIGIRAGKPGGNRENKHRPAASGVPSLLDKNSCGVSVGVFLQPVSSIHSSPLKNLRFVDTASLDEYFDHAGTGSWEDARKCLFLLVGRTGIEPVIR